MLEHSPCGSESFGEQASYIPSIMLGKDKRALAGVAVLLGPTFCAAQKYDGRLISTVGHRSLFSVVAVAFSSRAKKTASEVSYKVGASTMVAMGFLL